MKHAILHITAFAALATAAYGQPPVIRSITRYRVSPAHHGDFQAAIKDYNEVLRKAGFSRSHTIWNSVTGPREYAWVSFSLNYAEFAKAAADDPALKDYGRQPATITARFNACVENSDRILKEMLPGLSINSPAAPVFVRVVRMAVRPDRVNDFMALVRRYGGPATEFRAMAGWDKWSDFDGRTAIAKAMGEEKFARYQDKLAPMLVESQSDIYRYRPDLSYIPARTTTK